MQIENDKARYIIIKIPVKGLSHCEITRSHMRFIATSGDIIKDIDLTGMLKNVLDIPMFIKNIIEQSSANLPVITESINVDKSKIEKIIPQYEIVEADEYDEESEIDLEDDDYMQADYLATFDLKDGSTFDIYSVQDSENAIIYYDFIIYTQDRLIMDMILNPIDMMYIDMITNEMYTLESGHKSMKFSEKRIQTFLYPELKKPSTKVICTKPH